jgi:hypothetical protein
MRIVRHSIIVTQQQRLPMYPTDQSIPRTPKVLDRVRGMPRQQRKYGECPSLLQCYDSVTLLDKAAYGCEHSPIAGGPHPRYCT